MSNSSDLLLDRLREHFKSHTKVDFCRNTGIPPQTLKNWLAGTSLPLEAVDVIAKELGYKSTWQALRPDAELPTPPAASTPVELLAQMQAMREENRELKEQILKRLPEPLRPELWPLFGRAVTALTTLEEPELGDALSEIESLSLEGDLGDDEILSDIESDEPPLNRPKKAPRSR